MDGSLPAASADGGVANGRIDRYDFVLALIPVAFAASLFADTVLSVPTPLALVVASLLGGLAVVDALFVNPPT